MLLLAVLHAWSADIPVERPCATPWTWSEISPILPELPPPPDGPGLRDAYGVPNLAQSQHFALRWGNQSFVDDLQIDVVLDALEDSWAVEIEEMGHSTPFGTGQYLFNVYIGDTGNGAPPGYGAGGYYMADEEGWPMIVIARDSLEDPEWTRITASHEFYHAVQGATERYNYDTEGPSAWFWEATATWASQVVYPDNGYHAVFLFGYAFLPNRRVNFFDYPDSGALQEYFQYGAFLFAVSVSETTGGWQVVRNTWEDEGTLADPLEVMRSHLTDAGFDLDEVWMEHAARNATMDYKNGELYRQVLLDNSWRDESSRRVVGEISGSRGTEGLVAPRSGLAPERYGSNRWTLSPVLEGEYHIRVAGEPTGTYGSEAKFAAKLVIENWGQEPEYVDVPFNGVEGELRYAASGAEDRVHIVVGAWTPLLNGAWNLETFPYKLEVEKVVVAVPEPEPVEEKRGCGCASTSSGASWLPLIALSLLGRLRRRA